MSSKPLPTSMAKGKKVLRHVLLMAAKHNIPSGYRKDYIPDLSTEAKHLVNQRDEARSRDPKDPDDA
jgi:putative aminopeptidase FrvX